MSAATKIATPPRSRCLAFGDRDSFTNRTAARTVSNPNGRLIRKIGRQLRPNRSALTSSPPSTLPEKDDVPITVPNNPNAFARSVTGKVTCMIESTCGNSKAPAIPCSARAAIRNNGDGRQAA